ncbi:hypothetical protein M9H77_02506 [Catharanthus roseus]|uniref:Uncharacterized protein n=1 Tax=Catharanthus roseus TaxID=4058 RepID=A0ACC0C8Q5_CATRO|nr:hypothetical protein M9H77_02506 [Catharanthus roseus]
MLRRSIRLRREYLYGKILEGKERLLYKEKGKIRQAVEEGKPIPTELRNKEYALRQEIDREDDNTAVLKSTIDDEYANAAERDPKILLTTSRDPRAPLTEFVKELKFVFPNSQWMNRGGQVIFEIIETCQAHDFTDVILVHEHRGVPDGLVISHRPYGPTAYLACTMWTANILKHLFPVPKVDTKRIITFAKTDYFSFSLFVSFFIVHECTGIISNEKRGGPKSIELKEIGPRFELRPYQIKLGTMDQDEAQNEWVLRPFINTSKKRKILGDS